MNQKQTARKVVYVSAVCAAIGVLLGWGAKLQFDLGWWIVPVASIVAGSLAWVIYDFTGVLAGVKQAWREVASWRWHPDWARIGVFLEVFLKTWFYWGVTILGMCFWLLGHTMYWINYYLKKKSNATEGVNEVIFLLLASIVVIFSCIIALEEAAQIPKKAKSSIKEARDNAFYCNPISFPFTIVYFLAKGLIWVATRIPRATAVVVGSACRLVVISFVLIHSEERRICFTATGLGTAIGLITCYQHGNAFFGAVIGGLVGGGLGRFESRWGKRLADELSRRWLKESVI